jgi:hypothetical protein
MHPLLLKCQRYSYQTGVGIVRILCIIRGDVFDCIYPKYPEVLQYPGVSMPTGGVLPRKYQLLPDYGPDFLDCKKILRNQSY